jgi:hypothetical protein
VSKTPVTICLLVSLTPERVSFSSASVIDTGENTEIKINRLPLPVGEKSVELENQGFGYKSKPNAYIRY